MRYSYLALSLMLLGVSPAMGQKKASKSTAQAEMNDVNTPLHLLKADYKIPYGTPRPEDVKDAMDRVLKYVDASTPTGVVDKNGKSIDLKDAGVDSHIKTGTFRLTAYEWGVVYNAMLQATETTGDKSYRDYAVGRMNFIANAAHHYRGLMEKTGYIEPNLRQMLDPRALDDCGAICSAMMKMYMSKWGDGDQSALKEQIDVYFNRVMYTEYHLSDGTLARTRPYYNSVWLDDMYMGIPSIALKGKMDRESRFYAAAGTQVKLFKEKMFMEDRGLFRHGWVESMQPHPAFHWARANGWAMLAMTELLDATPSTESCYNEVKALLIKHINSVASLQTIDGFWHQLLDRPETYEETSATAIYTYCIAHAINNGWIDAKAYGPIAIQGWNAVASKITSDGKVEGTCVGTGMGFDAAFYAYRPVSAAAAHGYGPVVLAASEIYKMISVQNPSINDSALMFYPKSQSGTASMAGGTFSVADPTRPVEIVAGSTRKGNRPVMFIIGDSTVKNGRGLGDGDMWGWASFFHEFVDLTKVSVENHALGGRSSRTFITEGLWRKVLDGIRPGDYLVIQFGHNDGGPLGTGRARASLRGTGNESELVTMERHGGQERVYTYGHYMREYIRQAKAKGATVIALSHTPGNKWVDANHVRRCDQTYGAWTKTVAEEEGVYYVDVNTLAANEYDKIGQKTAARDYFKDSVHTLLKGAIMYCKVFAQGLVDLGGPLADLIDKSALTKEFGGAQKPVYRDPVCDGAADPTIIWNDAKRCYTMYYTNRRANVEGLSGVEWVHGTKIGMAESYDFGNTWTYAGEAKLNYGDEQTTFWAPDVVKEGSLYHMFVTVVPGIFSDWRHPRMIVHMTSTDMVNWTSKGEVKLASDRVIDAGLIKEGNKWLMFYNNENTGKNIYYAESTDLNNWTDKGLAVQARGEGPKVFKWGDIYYMIVDEWRGLGVYHSFDLKNWVRQEENILAGAGSGIDDGVMGGHCDVVVADGKAYLYYFTHPGRVPSNTGDNYETRRSSIQVVELKVNKGVVSCDRDKNTVVFLENKE